MKRFFDIFNEIILFIEKTPALAKFLDIVKNPQFLIELAFLTDMCGILNDLNLKLQGNGQSIFELSGAIKGFKNKLLRSFGNK